MTVPNLSGVVVKGDVFKKGAADYISWARIANYLHEHANGWEFNLQPAPQGGHVWHAPDGTGYLLCYFTGPEDQATPDFPYAVTDNRNAPIPAERISARALCDSHRRAMCACAAFSFSLGYELWAKEEVSAAQDEESQPAPAKPSKAPVAKPAPKVAEPKPEPAQDTPAPTDAPASKGDVTLILNLLKEADPKLRTSVIDAYRAEFGLAADAKIATHVATASHVQFLQNALG